MVEAIVSFAVQRLGDALIQEAVSLHGVHEQVEQLGNELRRMLCFLKDADSKEQQGDELVRNWVSEIRDVAYDSEDVIDTFVLKVASRERGGIMNLLIKSACILNTRKHQYKVGKEIQSILTKLQNISDSRVKYDIKGIHDEETPSSVANQKLQQQLRRSYPHVEDEDVIGLEEHTSELIAELTKEEERRCVISIIGVGGLGKTTLAKNAYRHSVVENHFQFCAWTFVSQRCSRRDILIEILKNASLSSHELKEIEDRNEEDLVQLLYKYLQDKRYLVVLDDIWMKGSKVLLTTRNKEVALRADPWSLHLEPRFLTDKESWGLLCNKALPTTNIAETSISPALQKIGREMVRKCGGLPLAVTVLGGLLATKKTDITEWEIVQRNMHTHMNRVMGILSLSYNDLPYHLKPCFLYLGLFPEDCEIPARKLIQLCMVQVSERSLTGRVKTCLLHDLMRDLCLLRAREENFLEIRDREVAESATTHCRLRRLAIHKDQERYTSLGNSSHLRLRTLVYCPNQNSYLFYSVQLHHQNLKLLRVLDLRGIYDDTKGNITKQIGKLVHLRYLGLTNIRIGRISPDIGNLQYLQTLDLSGYFGTVPKTIQKMEHLRHLHLHYGHKNLQIGNLVNLQTLKWVTAGRWIIEGGLIKMTNLQKLGLCKLLGSELEEILDSIVHRSTDHNPLRSLYLHLDLKKFFPNMERLSQCHNLQKLSLRGFCRANYFKFPPNITKLTLATTCFFQDPWADLQHLPNLKYLSMKTAYNGEELVCKAEGFPQLQHLHLKKLPNLKQFRVHKGGMPSLKHLEISNCSKLVMLPRGLKFVTTIQKLEINNMPSDFQARVSKKGPEWYKVRHISSITFKVDLQTNSL
ncbi:hypothetical protein MKW92_006898 [Papaver armeniacum]|nr:hypothetical protein MKW92_006898 [Papaver armeniacum]